MGNKKELLKEIDNQEKRIIGELIKNPRISDNQISRNTGIPLKTVNTKRKKLEANNLLRYFVELDNSSNGTELFSATQLYEVTLRLGITKKFFYDVLLPKINHMNRIRKHLHTIFFGEHNGHVVVFFIIRSYNDLDIVEIFNAEIYPILNSALGNNAVENVRSIKIVDFTRMFHNYFVDTKSNELKTDDNLFVYEK